jgi:hypothetical protein
MKVTSLNESISPNDPVVLMLQEQAREWLKQKELSQKQDPQLPQPLKQTA